MESLKRYERAQPNGSYFYSLFQITSNQSLMSMTDVNFVVNYKHFIVLVNVMAVSLPQGNNRHVIQPGTKKKKKTRMTENKIIKL